MRYATQCSGIEAPSVAWHPLGWRPVFFSEIEKFPCAVLGQRWPGIPNYGDMTGFKEWPDATLDLLCAGTPCQSFSVAGLRKGLDDPRGNLMLTYLATAARFRPRWLVWENVPGVLSIDGGRAFAALLGGMGQLGYGTAYRVLDAQYFGVPQRRRRVFVVGCLGDWRAAAAVLFERHCLQGHPAPSRETRERIARPIAAGSARGSGYRNDADTADNMIALPVTCRVDRGGEHREAHGNNLIVAPEIARCVATREGTSQDWETTTMVAHSLRADGFDASEDGTGRGTPIIPFDTTQITSAANYSRPKPGDPCHPLARGAHVPAIAFSAKDHGGDAGELAPTLRAGGHTGSHANAGVMPAIAFDARQSDVIQYGEKTGPLDTDGHTMGIRQAMQVRRLTPRECERLQGFADDYTLIEYRGKPAADGPRYKALGNSMAVPVVRWIGERIAMVDELIPA